MHYNSVFLLSLLFVFCFSFSLFLSIQTHTQKTFAQNLQEYIPTPQEELVVQRGQELIDQLVQQREGLTYKSVKYALRSLCDKQAVATKKYWLYDTLAYHASREDGLENRTREPHGIDWFLHDPELFTVEDVTEEYKTNFKNDFDSNFEGGYIYSICFKIHSICLRVIDTKIGLSQISKMIYGDSSILYGESPLFSNIARKKYLRADLPYHEKVYYFQDLYHLIVINMSGPGMGLYTKDGISHIGNILFHIDY